MGLEKTKTASASHTEEEVKSDLKNEEDTSTDDGQSAQNEVESEEDTSKTQEESEESMEELKARLEKLEEERDNYKKGLLSLKAKGRTLDALAIDKQEKREVEEEVVDIAEQKVLEVINKQNERKVLRSVIDPTSKNYMPELIDDEQYQDIIQYLPRTLDRTTEEGIINALRVAVNSWRFITGKTKKEQKEKVDITGLGAMKKEPSARSSKKEQKERRRILPLRETPQEWYK